MEHDYDPGVAQLLERALPDRPDDPHRLVTAGISRGRALRRRRRTGTAVAALAVFGVIGGIAAVVPHLSGEGTHSTPVASDPGSTSLPSARSDPSPSAAPAVPRPDVTAITMAARDVPAAVEAVLGRDGSGPLKQGESYPQAADPDKLNAHFTWQGTLTSVVIDKVAADSQAQCKSGAAATGGKCTTTVDGYPLLTWGPTLGDGVTAQGVTEWRADFEVSVLSYNAAEGKGVAPLAGQPPLSFDDLSMLADSDVWFE